MSVPYADEIAEFNRRQEIARYGYVIVQTCRVCGRCQRCLELEREVARA